MDRPGHGDGPRRGDKAVSISRRVALAVLRDVAGGSYVEDSLTRRLDAERSIGRADRALATELVYGVVRWQARLDSIIDGCSNHPASKILPAVRDILRLGMYQLFLLERVPDHSAVDEAVSLARRRLGAKTAGFVNALLRRAARERTTLDPPPSDAAESLAVYYSHAQWLVERWCGELGSTAARMVLAHNNTPVPLVLRANSLKTARDALAEVFCAQGFQVEAMGKVPSGLRVHGARVSVRTLPGYGEGMFAVQETASQMIAPLLGAGQGERVLDVCAAPGGKTAHIAALVNNEARITAVDRDASRLTATGANLKRLGVTCVKLIQGDSRDRAFLQRLGTFDRILVDPPCSGLGVLRHNPEAKNRVRRDDLRKYANKELEILLSAASVLRPGGTLIYSVCTPMREETVGVVEQFLSGSPEFSLVPIRPDETRGLEFVLMDGFFSTFPPSTEEPMDSFFAARFTR